MTVVVREFDQSASVWDAFVRGQPGWSHMHLFGWQRVMERVFHHECSYLGAWDDENSLIGILPLVHVRSLVFGRFLVSMPFLNYGGPLGHERSIGPLVEESVALAQRSGASLLELRSRTSLAIDLPASHRKITVTLALPSTSAVLWKQLDAKVRSQVRRPQKDGVELRFGPDQAEPFFRVFARHMRDLGTPTQPRRLFEAIAETFGDDAWFACSYYRGQAIAGGCALRSGHELEITWASALVEHKALSANMLLYWGMMERAIDAGIATFNFGRCTPGGGTHRFKRQWGGIDEPLSWYTWSRGALAATPSPNDSAYSWGPRLWKRLPVSVATALGPSIVRYIP
jgi:FemAB-related protein (PEP-CTERM system-associated)